MRNLLLLCVVFPGLSSLAYANESQLPPLSLKLSLLAAEPQASGQKDLDFDLLGEAPKPKEIDTRAIKLRRTMLTIHQSEGIGLVALTTSLCIVGQLNYNDRFGSGGSTGKYETPHAVLAFSTLGLFTATALAAIFAPLPFERPKESVDRTMLHKIGLFSAAAGMAAEGALGIATVSREGYLNQKTLAKTHLIIGYGALAAMLFGVSALVF